ncbi:TPA: PerC family transcriptional regulator [Escherichia coli]|nr:PerC family transcriptional regulator [Escherichia coli]HAV9637828.1 PerC family transcriptional regulator [Escherichia coli]HAV9655504.1 PerC family transcriptional regulator [Escherichia coli]HAW0238672.1 PerC family transcriptional regulator [Escherichia coli]HAW0924901.1 PerC family transcriptional regulator [Escherichia coli]
MIKDKKAEELERKGLWRRAARRWLELSCAAHRTEMEKKLIIERHQYCMSMIHSPQKEKHDFSALKEAINRTSREMGLIKDKKNIHDSICFK